MINGVEHNYVETFIDDRGFLSQILPEGKGNFAIRRIYSTRNYAIGTIRGFHKHRIEHKAFFVVSGSAKFVLVDDRQDSTSYKKIDTFVMSHLKPSVLYVPTGIYTGWMSLSENTLILGISTEPINTENPDDERLDPHSFGDVWSVKDR